MTPLTFWILESPDSKKEVALTTNQILAVDFTFILQRIEIGRCRLVMKNFQPRVSNNRAAPMNYTWNGKLHMTSKKGQFNVVN